MNQIWVSRELESGAQSSEPMLKKRKKKLLVFYTKWSYVLSGSFLTVRVFGTVDYPQYILNYIFFFKTGEILKKKSWHFNKEYECKLDSIFSGPLINLMMQRFARISCWCNTAYISLQ